MAETFSDILGEFTPLTLTESINLLRLDEAFILKSKLGENVINMPDDRCVFEVEEGNYNLAPTGYINDPAMDVNVANKITPYAITPPQIFIKDTLTAGEVARCRIAGMNYINQTRDNKEFAFNQLIATKQQGMLKLIERRTEWLIAQALNGSISYTSETGRKFEFNYGQSAGVTLTGNKWDASSAGNPIHQLREMVKEYKRRNNQLSPDLIIMDGAAGEAFLNNVEVEKWLQSPGAQIFELKAGLAKDDTQPIGVLQGAEIYEYSATYKDSNGAVKSYLDSGYVYMTNSKLWRLFYGAIYDFDAGAFPLVTGSYYSKMKPSEDGKSLVLYAEAHPLPVVASVNGVLRVKVLS